MELENGTREVEHLSVTKIEAAGKCQEQFRLRYEERIPEPSGGIMIAGRAVHAVIEWALKRVQMGQPLPDAKDADDKFLEEWKGQFGEEAGKPTFVALRWDEGDPPEKVERECRALIPFILKEILPGIKPRLVEHSIKIPFDSDVGPFLVWGVIDLLRDDGVLVDWKTTLKVSLNARKRGMQFPGYSCEVVKLTGQEVTPCQRVFLIRGTRPKVEVVKFMIGPVDREWFAYQAAQAWKMCKARSYVANTGGYWCSTKFCSFFGMCQGELQ